MNTEDRVAFLKRLANTEWLAYADRQRLLALAEPQAEIEALIADVKYILDKFNADEAAGYRSRDRQFAIELLSRHSALLTLEPGGSEPPQDAGPLCRCPPGVCYLHPSLKTCGMRDRTFSVEHEAHGLTAQMLVDWAAMIEQFCRDLAAASSPPPQDYKALYFDLLYQVEKKHPNETRHETARRYIQQAEQGSNQACAAVSQGEPQEPT